MLLGLGPKADGTMPEHQVKVVKELGGWMKINGEAIYSTHPYNRFYDKTNKGKDVRYTVKNGFLYAIIIGNVSGEVSINNLQIREHSKVLNY